MINTYDLKSFIVTAKHLHFTKAAKELGLSQPALSHAIKRLEEEVGDSLFLRRKEGVLLTKTGSYLFKRGEAILFELEDISNHLDADKKLKIQTLSLGLHPSVGSYTLPHIFEQMTKFNLNLKFDLSREVTSLVQEGKIDCALAINPFPHSNLIINELGEDHFQAWTHSKKYNADCLFYDPQLHQSHFLLRQLEKNGFRFKKIVGVPNLELIAQLVYSGSGVGLVPGKVILNNKTQNTKILSMKIKPFIDKICFVYSVENKQNENIKVFKNQLINYFKNN